MNYFRTLASHSVFLLVLLVFLLSFALYDPILMHCTHYVCVGLMCVYGRRLLMALKKETKINFHFI